MKYGKDIIVDGTITAKSAVNNDEVVNKGQLATALNGVVAGVGTGATPVTHTSNGTETVWDVNIPIVDSGKWFVNGTKLVLGEDYTVSGSIFTLTGYVPVSGNKWTYYPDIAVPTNYDAGGDSSVSNKQITSSGVILGDSTVADWAGNTAMSTLILTTEDTNRGDTVTGDANAGDTIDDQLIAWNADINKSNYDWIYVQIGHNDITDVATYSSIKVEYQGLINQINADRKEGSVLIIGVLTPAYSRYETLFGVGTNADLAQANHNALNADIVSNEFGADYVLNSYRYLLGESSNRDILASAYNGSGDGIHPNDAGRQINADELRVLLNNIGFLATVGGSSSGVTKPTVRLLAFNKTLENGDLNNKVLHIGTGNEYIITVPDNTVLTDVEVGDIIEITVRVGNNHIIAPASGVTLLDPTNISGNLSVGYRAILEYVNTNTWLLSGSQDTSLLANKQITYEFSSNKFAIASEFNNTFVYKGSSLSSLIIPTNTSQPLSNGSWFELIVDSTTGTCTIEGASGVTLKLKSGINVTAMADGGYRKAIKISTDTWYITD